MTEKNMLLVLFKDIDPAARGVMLFTYDIIKIEWISFMEIQPSYEPMDSPLAVAANSIPFEGAAYIPGQGSPVNLVVSDAVSVERGRVLFSVNCVMCHGATGEGNGIIGGALVNPPANLPGAVTQSKADGALFLTISNGVEGRMPALNENLTVRDRWDLVNYIRTLKPSQP
jgi:mono/diheme cytochrome c family protein